MSKLLAKLEEIKQSGAYAITLSFGEDVGCDDCDVPLMDRRTIVIWCPVGCLGEVKKMFYGKMKDFLALDISQRPKPLTNPPKEEYYKQGGYFAWGTERMVETERATGTKVT